jgi:hypothetical protein
MIFDGLPGPNLGTARKIEASTASGPVDCDEGVRRHREQRACLAAFVRHALFRRGPTTGKALPIT